MVVSKLPISGHPLARYLMVNTGLRMVVRGGNVPSSSCKYLIPYFLLPHAQLLPVSIIFINRLGCFLKSKFPTFGTFCLWANLSMNTISTIKGLPLGPLVTGPVVLFLLTGSAELRNKVAHFLTSTPGLRKLNINTIVLGLKVLIGYWLVTRTNTILNSLALNHWSLKKKGAPWDFPNEIAVVTGGSSGFGKLMTERLAPRLKRVIVLDVQDKPKEFEDSQSLD